MTVSIPLLTLMVIVVYVAYRHMGLRVWHAVVCLILGFLLASTGAAPRDQQRDFRHRPPGAALAVRRKGLMRDD